MAKKTESKDSLVAKLQEVVKQKKAEIAQIERPNYQTNLSFKTMIGNTINLNTVSDEEVLVEVLSQVLFVEDYVKEARSVLGLPYQEVKMYGFTRAQWESDLKTKLGKLQLNSKRAELETIEKRLAALESPELRAQRELDEIQNLLK